MTSSYIRLVERSKIAKELGGPEKIRMLPLEDRLRINAVIAKELGREKAEVKCATMAVKMAISRCDYSKADIIAKEHNLTGYIQFLDALQKIV